MTVRSLEVRVRGAPGPSPPCTSEVVHPPEGKRDDGGLAAGGGEAVRWEGGRAGVGPGSGRRGGGSSGRRARGAAVASGRGVVQTLRTD